MTTASVELFWREFCALEPSVSADTPYQTWYFGNTRQMAAELADLVLSGRKTATASLVAMNELNPSDAPQPNGYSVITDFDGEPLCVLQTIEIRHIAFDEVDAQFAADEGEGDLSHDYWRQVHWDYFSREAEQNGFEFDGGAIVCCERFRVLYPR